MEVKDQYVAIEAFLKERHFKDCAANILVDYDTGKEHNNVLFYNKKAGLAVEVSESNGIAGVCRAVQRPDMTFEKQYVVAPCRLLFNDISTLAALLDEFGGVKTKKEAK